MTVPNAVVISYSDSDGLDLIRGILRTEKLPDNCICYEDGLKSYPWKIDTKYFTADIHLCHVINDQFGSNSDVILNKMQALVVQFDSSKESSFNRVKMLHSLINGYEPDVRLIVCGNCTENTLVTRTVIQTWGLENGYELVELNSEESNDIDDDFAETVGLERIIQALHSHTWSNLIMKDKSILRSPNIDKLTNCKEFVEGEEHRPSLDNKKSVTATREVDEASGIDKTEENAEEIKNILKTLESDDGQSFEQLFERFQIMKDTARSMNFEERKLYAEKVAVDFWKAIGGDEEEITELNLD